MLNSIWSTVFSFFVFVVCFPVLGTNLRNWPPVRNMIRRQLAPTKKKKLIPCYGNAPSNKPIHLNGFLVYFTLPTGPLSPIQGFYNSSLVTPLELDT